jgi:hypothetical protein
VIRPHGEAKIDCPLGIFADHEREIGRLTEALNLAPNPAAKAGMAGQLRDATAVLLSCAGYQEDNVNCRLCREFSRLRNQTAARVSRAAGLAG